MSSTRGGKWHPQAWDEPIIHTLEPSGSGCEAKSHPEVEAAGGGVSPRKEPNPSPNNKVRTPPLSKKANKDENIPGHEPPQESVAEPVLIVGSTSALMSEQNTFDTISVSN